GVGIVGTPPAQGGVVQPAQDRLGCLGLPLLAFVAVAVVQVAEILEPRTPDVTTGPVCGLVLAEQEQEVAGVVVALPAATGALKSAGTLVPDEAPGGEPTAPPAA